MQSTLFTDDENHDPARRVTIVQAVTACLVQVRSALMQSDYERAIAEVASLLARIESDAPSLFVRGTVPGRVGALRGAVEGALTGVPLDQATRNLDVDLTILRDYTASKYQLDSIAWPELTWAPGSGALTAVFETIVRGSGEKKYTSSLRGNFEYDYGLDRFSTWPVYPSDSIQPVSKPITQQETDDTLRLIQLVGMVSAVEHQLVLLEARYAHEGAHADRLYQVYESVVASNLASGSVLHSNERATLDTYEAARAIALRTLADIRRLYNEIEQPNNEIMFLQTRINAARDARGVNHLPSDLNTITYP